MAIQVLLYVKVREGYEFIYGDRNGDSDENLLVSSLSSMRSRGDQNDETNLSAANRDEANDSEPAVAHIYTKKKQLTEPMRLKPLTNLVSPTLQPLQVMNWIVTIV